MSGLSWILIIGAGIFWLQTNEQRRRMGLLAKHLAPTRVEKILGTLIDGYLKALELQDPERQQHAWNALGRQEQELMEHFQRFADGFATESAEATRVSTLPLGLPLLDRILPAYTFDMRQALALHAQAIRAACAPEGLDAAARRDFAFTMTAELLLMQHTCHWFGKTRTIASIRLVTRHKTQYEQVLASVAPTTRRAYLKLIGDSN